MIILRWQLIMEATIGLPHFISHKELNCYIAEVCPMRPGVFCVGSRAVKFAVVDFPFPSLM